jgi:hypothetical protein
MLIVFFGFGFFLFKRFQKQIYGNKDDNRYNDFPNKELIFKSLDGYGGCIAH